MRKLHNIDAFDYEAAEFDWLKRSVKNTFKAYEKRESAKEMQVGLGDPQQRLPKPARNRIPCLVTLCYY